MKYILSGRVLNREFYTGIKFPIELSTICVILDYIWTVSQDNLAEIFSPFLSAKHKTFYHQFMHFLVKNLLQLCWLIGP